MLSTHNWKGKGKLRDELEKINIDGRLKIKVLK